MRSSDQLFTIILAFLGGTYIYQIRARGPHAALAAWVKEVPARYLKLYTLSRNELQTFTENEDDSAPVPIRGCTNVWYTSGLFRGEHAGINIIATREGAPVSKTRSLSMPSNSSGPHIARSAAVSATTGRSQS